MNTITKILNVSLTNLSKRRKKQKLAKVLNKLELENKQIKQQTKILDVLANSLNYCCHLPANHPHYIDWERAEPAINILFNYTLMLDRQSRQLESKIKQLPESVKK